LLTCSRATRFKVVLAASPSLLVAEIYRRSTNQGRHQYAANVMKEQA
jgi:hypothetical protein